MEILWYLTAPDGPFPWNKKGARKIDYAYMQQLARAIDHLGYSGALLATGVHDTWVLGSALIPFTERMRFLVAVHPGLLSPTLFAKMAATFEQFSRGRLLINIVNGTSNTMAANGLHLSHDERYAHCDEYLTVWRQLMVGETVDFEGKYVHVKKAKLGIPPVQSPHPPLWFGGSSDPALEVAAKHIDTYLTWGEAPPQVAERIVKMRSLAAKYNRTLRFGIRLYVIVRETEQEAWDAADWLLKRMDEESVAAIQKMLTSGDSVGQQRMLEFHGGKIPKNVRELEIYPNLWAGLGLVRPGPGTAVVGDPKTVASRLQEYADIGIETFIISGIPLIEEAYRVADLLLPLLPVSQPTNNNQSSSSVHIPTWSGFKDIIGATETKQVQAG
ncbi:LLM class flavin-dependent oxidoreductase [Scytonema hofmannii]|uniref:LLM class flavin-dependent oxidoreductase n=1 Tax=Scytonema hofmannii TaxID=34078 RepID=UPI00037F549E|nr:LLM class flavin-dependent oxidoreductase [Scytonema hofmannii]